MGEASTGGNTPVAYITRSVAMLTAKIDTKPAATAPMLRSTPGARRGGAIEGTMGWVIALVAMAVLLICGRRRLAPHPRVGAASPFSTSSRLFFVMRESRRQAALLVRDHGCRAAGGDVDPRLVGDGRP